MSLQLERIRWLDSHGLDNGHWGSISSWSKDVQRPEKFTIETVGYVAHETSAFVLVVQSFRIEDEDDGMMALVIPEGLYSGSEEVVSDGYEFTQAQKVWYVKVCGLAWALHHPWEEDDDGELIPPEEIDTYLLIGERSWLFPFHICPHRKPDALVTTAPDEQPAVYDEPNWN